MIVSERFPAGDGFAGIDAGGTKVHVRYLAPGAQSAQTFGLRSADYDSLDALFDDCLTTMGHVPRRLVAGVAGRPQSNGDVRITNRPGWPAFKRDRFASRHGLQIEIVNDMVATVAGISELAAADYTALTSAVQAGGPAQLVVAIGTGVGVGHRDQDGKIHATEAGHMPWQPVTDLEVDYLCWLRAKPPAMPISVEQSISGLHGLENLYDFLSAAHPPASRLRADVASHRAAGRGIGPLLTAAALTGDPLCRQLMRLFGGILGQFLRSMALTTLCQGGSIWLTGSVVQSAGLTELLGADEALARAFLGAGAQHSDLMQQIPIFVVGDREVAVKGALALSRSAETRG